ncbi:hypothetical protein V7128_26485 [Neobacillus vireti]|uniref:hypothetical protein n=1 Tax=Neobacillus vireti TaxID=220686 RepID=UPI002FFFA6CF
MAGNFKKEFNLVNFDNYILSGYKTTDVIAQLNNGDVQKGTKEAPHLTIDMGLMMVSLFFNRIRQWPQRQLGRLQYTLTQFLVKLMN